ncbi:MAG: recombinase family protein [Halobacteriovoraceae bacterium]|nr:recombinase family protein [Halobacteriovoraceae bacterium]
MKAPTLRFGEKLIGTTRVVHKGEQKVIEKMISLREKGYSFKRISEYLNDKNIPTKLGGSWYPSTVKDIVKRELKRRED